MKLRSEGIYILLVLSILMILATAFITYQYSLEVKQARQTAIRRYRSIESGIQLLSLMKDMETGQRGYIISGDSDFLEPYKQAKGNIKAEIDTLKRLVNDNEQQTSLLEEKIIAAINTKSEDMENSISILNTFGRDSAVSRVNTKIGMARMDTLRSLVQGLVQQERVLLSQMRQKLATNESMEDNFRFLALALIALTSLAAIFRLLKKRRNIKQLIESLQDAKDNLEIKVQERTKELVDANQAKDHFLGIASHDLKVPISGVLGLIELMNLENAGRPRKEIEYLSYMKDSCTNMQGLISNLLDINRIETGVHRIQKKDVDLGELILNLEKDFSHPAERKHIKLSFDRSKGKVYTDSDALSCILENLLSNAIKFSPGGKCVQLKSTISNGLLQFEVIDQGPGIIPEEMPKLFEKFQKLSNKPTGGEGSTGLGLAIVKELTSLLGGQITVNSKIGQGTTFTLIIPA